MVDDSPIHNQSSDSLETFICSIKYIDMIISWHTS